MKTHYKIFLLIAIVFVGTSSCKKYLDVIPDDTGTLDYAFRNRNEAENYLFSCYTTLQQMADPTSNIGFTTSSEIIYPNNLTQHPILETGFDLIRGTQNSANVGINWWDGKTEGRHFTGQYAAVTLCLIILMNQLTLVRQKKQDG